MCGGIEFHEGSRIIKVFFPNPAAALPVVKKSGEVSWVPWGRRNDNADQRRIRLPNGGWARLQSIHDGKWRAYHASPVIIPVQAFMEKDNEGQSHWFPLASGMAIQGLLARSLDEDVRVYVVTESPPPVQAHIHDRWPRIIRWHRDAKETPAGLPG